jgi:hypothetical protein
MRDQARRSQANRAASHVGCDPPRDGAAEVFADEVGAAAVGGATFATGNTERATIGCDEVFTCIGNPLFARGVLFERGESFGSEASAAITNSGVEECAEFQVKVARREVLPASFEQSSTGRVCGPAANLYDEPIAESCNGFAGEND